MLTSILQILAAAIGLGLTWYSGKFLTKWLSRYRRTREKGEVSKHRKLSEDMQLRRFMELEQLKRMEFEWSNKLIAKERARIDQKYPQ